MYVDWHDYSDGYIEQWLPMEVTLANTDIKRHRLQADIGRRVEPYRRSLSLFDGRVRRVEPYRRKLSLPNLT